MSQLPSLFNPSSRNSFNDLRSMQRQMDRWFEDLLTPATGLAESSSLLSQSFAPTCDVEETDSHYLLAFDLPGVKKDDIKMSIEEGLLTVSAERKEEREESKRKSYRKERFYGTYERSIRIPATAKAEQVEADYADGVLRVAIPKGETPRTQPIKIGDGKSGFWSKALGLKKEEKGQAH